MTRRVPFSVNHKIDTGNMTALIEGCNPAPSLSGDNSTRGIGHFAVMPLTPNKLHELSAHWVIGSDGKSSTEITITIYNSLCHMRSPLWC